MIGIAVDDQQRVIQVLAVVPVIGTALLGAVGGITSPVTIEDAVGGRAVLFPLAQGALAQHPDVTVLPPGERGVVGSVYPLWGNRPQTRLRSGSVRRASAPFWSS